MFKFDIFGVQERRKGGREWGRDEKEEEEGRELREKLKIFRAVGLN